MSYSTVEGNIQLNSRQPGYMVDRRVSRRSLSRSGLDVALALWLCREEDVCRDDLSSIALESHEYLITELPDSIEHCC